MFYYNLIIQLILCVNFGIKLIETRNIIDNNNNVNSIKNEYKNKKNSYNKQRELEHICEREVPKIYLEHYRNYTLISEEIGQQYFVKMEVCCDGYKRSKYNWNKCVPYCTDCEHGICTEPGVCECYPNYIKNHKGICVLKCPVYCDNGRCKIDGTCKCNPGYILDESQQFCRPHCNTNNKCNAIHYQHCSEPNVCACLEGYQITRSRCEPICKHNCGINGTCESPNKCRCHGGAVLKNGLCQAICYQKCDNGLCVASNRCICFDGFAYDQRTKSCIPDEGSLRNIDIEFLD